MKKIILPIIALLTNFGAIAQTTRAEKVLNSYRLGLFVSVGSSWLKPTSTTTSSTASNDTYDVTKGANKTSFSFGLSADKVLNERYAIYSGLSLDWMGGGVKVAGKLADSVGNINYAKTADMNYNLQYLQIPLGLKLKATNIDKFQIFGQLGMDLGFLIGRKANYSVVKYGSPTVFAKDGEKLGIKTMNPVSLGFQVGLGTEFEVSKNNSAYATILYRNGFLDHTLPGNRTEVEGKFADGNLRSNNITLRIGYYF